LDCRSRADRSAGRLYKNSSAIRTGKPISSSLGYYDANDTDDANIAHNAFHHTDIAGSLQSDNPGAFRSPAAAGPGYFHALVPVFFPAAAFSPAAQGGREYLSAHGKLGGN
jgi:hypothetical protein